MFAYKVIDTNMPEQVYKLERYQIMDPKSILYAHNLVFFWVIYIYIYIMTYIHLFLRKINKSNKTTYLQVV